MRTTRTCSMALALALALGGCGGAPMEPGLTSAAQSAVPGSLAPAGWIGGGPVKLTGKGDKLRVVLFVDLDDAASQQQARLLSNLISRHGDFELVAATKSNDEQAALEFIEQSGLKGALALGIASNVLDHYQVQQRPSLRVISLSGEVVGREAITLMAHLGRPERGVGTR